MSNLMLTDKQWRGLRDRLSRRMRRNLHVIEVNPGKEFTLRFDYMLTASEVSKFVEEIITETERTIAFNLSKK